MATGKRKEAQRGSSRNRRMKTRRGRAYYLHVAPLPQELSPQPSKRSPISTSTLFNPVPLLKLIGNRLGKLMGRKAVGAQRCEGRTEGE